MKQLILVVALGGCGFGSSPAELPRDGFVAPPIDGAVIDTPAPLIDGAVIDTPAPPAIDAQACFGHGLVNVCLTTLPSGPLTLTSAMSPYDTGTDANCPQRVMQNGIELCVLAGTSVTVPSAFVAIGARPLVVVALGDLTIPAGGVIDVSSKAGTRKGAGANTGPCSSGSAPEDDRGGGGGGGGGGLGIAGGAGGLGDSNRSTPQDGTAAGGGAGVVQTVTGLRGGCAGVAGGASDKPGGGGGDGGGGVVLIAGGKLTIDGAVFASGAGGFALDNNEGREQGGGGGGAGGVIGLDGAMIAIGGTVAANGGAGGGGGGLVTGGKPGEDGTTTMWMDRARHGDPGMGSSGAGADGTAQGKVDKLTPGAGDGGGGGGAGGLGFVRTDGPVTGGAQVSPTAIAH